MSSVTDATLNLYVRSSEFTNPLHRSILEVTYTQPVTVLVDEVDYTYNHAMRRVSKTLDEVTTYYPTSNYSVEGSATTVYIQGPSGLVASIETDPSTSSGSPSWTSTIHTDHLGSTSIVTDEDGIMIELLDYHPYGTQGD